MAAGGPCDPLRLALLLDWLSGMLGGPLDQQRAAQVTHPQEEKEGYSQLCAWGRQSLEPEEEGGHERRGGRTPVTCSLPQRSPAY